MGEDGLVTTIEKKLGLPSLSKISETFTNIPDTRQLKLIKEILVLADRVSGNAPDLEKVSILIQELNRVPVEKLAAMEKILRRIDKIIQKTPGDMLEMLSSLIKQ
ncbi:MAG: hypothetical protein PHQ43_01205 [Dehalococcoidales bacterium]|nr:hypothetical protein [Dehalococcoidales bacterium]